VGELNDTPSLSGGVQPKQTADAPLLTLAFIAQAVLLQRPIISHCFGLV
jgi:hypothetical protein